MKNGTQGPIWPAVPLSPPFLPSCRIRRKKKTADTGALMVNCVVIRMVLRYDIERRLKLGQVDLARLVGRKELEEVKVAPPPRQLNEGQGFRPRADRQGDKGGEPRARQRVRRLRARRA